MRHDDQLHPPSAQGGAATRAIRLDDMSMLCRVAAPLRAAVARYAGIDPTPIYDATLAGALQDFLKNVVLMDGLTAHGTSEAEFMAEALDSFRAHRSTADKLAVEEARFHLLEHECVPPPIPRHIYHTCALHVLCLGPACTMHVLCM